MNRPLDVLGVEVDMLEHGEALDRLEALHRFAPASFVSYVNPHTANLAFEDVDFGAALRHADVRLADGFGIRLAARRQHRRVPAILNGSDFNAALVERAAERGWPVFLLGGRHGVADAAAGHLAGRLPALRIAGTHHGYFDDAESGAVAARIRESGATLLLAGLGQPRQELWLAKHLPATGARLGAAVGGFLDFTAGEVPRAPAWMNRAGLEWGFRLAHEPRRLARRYLIGIPLYLWRITAPAGARAVNPSAAPHLPG